MRLIAPCLAIVAIFALSAAKEPAKTPGVPIDGKLQFETKCAMCHGTRGMGTVLLSRRLPSKLAPLEARADLAADMVEIAVRQGIGNMPPLSRAEVSDAELAAIARYLATPGSKR
jgi:mono/diheme cytochrome c family protein